MHQLGSQLVDDGVLMLCVMRQVPNVQDSGHSVRFSRPWRPADQNKGHLFPVLSNVEVTSRRLVLQKPISGLSRV